MRAADRGRITPDTLDENLKQIKMPKTYTFPGNENAAAAIRTRPRQLDVAGARQIRRQNSARDREGAQLKIAVENPGERPGVEVTAGQNYRPAGPADHVKNHYGLGMWGAFSYTCNYTFTIVSYKQRP